MSEHTRWLRQTNSVRAEIYREEGIWHRDNTREFYEEVAPEAGFRQIPRHGRPQLLTAQHRQGGIRRHAFVKPIAKDISLSRENDRSKLPDETTRLAWDEFQKLRYGWGYTRKFVFKKVLGWGGHGIAMAFDEVHPNSGSLLRPLVVKMALRGGDMEEEARIMKEFEHCEHTVQALNLWYVEKIPTTFRGHFNRYAYRPMKFLVMEWVENGDLANFIRRSREKGLVVPKTMLWHFFLCLTRMCIALKHPVKRHMSREDVRRRNLVTEEVPPGNGPPLVAPTTHFDLDPWNVFVGALDPNSQEHSVAPILKLGDFGLASTISQHTEGVTWWDLEANRHYAKPCYFTPEQFTVEWDYIRTLEELCQHPTAGNYGSHTNVYGIGLIMEALITLANPGVPPQAQNANVDGRTIISYGQTLADAVHPIAVDADMMDLIVLCQAHRLDQRPSLERLASEIKRNIEQKMYPHESDDFLRLWFHRVMEEEPPLADNGPDGHRAEEGEEEEEEGEEEQQAQAQAQLGQPGTVSPEDLMVFS